MGRLQNGLPLVRVDRCRADVNIAQARQLCFRNRLQCVVRDSGWLLGDH